MESRGLATAWPCPPDFHPLPSGALSGARVPRRALAAFQLHLRPRHSRGVAVKQVDGLRASGPQVTMGGGSWEQWWH